VSDTVGKLGRLKSRPDRRTLRMARYLTAELPPPPPRTEWRTRVNPSPGFLRSKWKMLLNDEIGDCVIAAADHLEMSWSWNSGIPFVPTDEQAQADYSAVTGYDPAHPETDQGADPLTVLKYWRNTGLAGIKIEAFVSTNAQRYAEVQQSINLFEGSFISLGLPLAAQELSTWDIPKGQPLTGIWEPESWGGHMVAGVDYDGDWMTIITWGEEKQMSRAFLDAYCDESYCVLCSRMLGSDGTSPLGFDMATLDSDLQLVSSLAP
jgi:hypothetical protein